MLFLSRAGSWFLVAFALILSKSGFSEVEVRFGRDSLMWFIYLPALREYEGSFLVGLCFKLVLDLSICLSLAAATFLKSWSLEFSALSKSILSLRPLK